MKKLLLCILLPILITACGVKKTSQPIHTPEPELNNPLITQNSKVIEVRDKSVKTGRFSKVNSCTYDFDADGEPDTLTLYSDAEPNSSGKTLWDDFHQWLLEVDLTSGGYATLFNNSISTGQLYFEVAEIYNDEVMPAVTTILTTGSSLDIEQFVFDGKSFMSTKLYSTENISKGGINRIYSSIPSYR